jgi:hypothetical protein
MFPGNMGRGNSDEIKNMGFAAGAADRGFGSDDFQFAGSGSGLESGGVGEKFASLESDGNRD